ncbi:class I SAM-dependent methyltransferase [Actinomadura sp. WMMB 499]|uniref:class I SAM-dependent DNA methyltransferase n=1 Tax=Actinomadura sp. WMMB 499 TaxID=1219491 RepID=UPI00124649FC|nr:class I SAM-dependent methyltransferase [Actinomadura sp. WMMB 499]QFG22942.1 class I SAM-dependent methyltransferase [Actinomadura sp. WMMB 499]
MGYGRRHAEIYDAVFTGRGKDWEGDARQVAGLVRERRRGARSLLDVACGTGAHLERFGALFDDVAGVELAEAMREIAVRRLPGVPVHAGDMRDFDLGRTFDAVACLSSSIGYLATVGDLHAAIGRMAGHLNPGGVLVIEPWWFPERFIDGYVGGHLIRDRDRDRVISRVTHSTRRERAVHIDVRFVVAEPGRGIVAFGEEEIVTLFARDEYEGAFRSAGCTVELLPGGPFGRGLFVGTRR